MSNDKIVKIDELLKIINDSKKLGIFDGYNKDIDTLTDSLNSEKLQHIVENENKDITSLLSKDELKLFNTLNDMISLIIDIKTLSNNDQSCINTYTDRIKICNEIFNKITTAISNRDIRSPKIITLMVNNNNRFDITSKTDFEVVASPPYVSRNKKKYEIFAEAKVNIGTVTYICRTEKLQYDNDVIESYYTLDGYYVGSYDFVLGLSKYNITPISASVMHEYTTTFGVNLDTNVYYVWDKTAAKSKFNFTDFRRFGVGTKIEAGDVIFKPSNYEDLVDHYLRNTYKDFSVIIDYAIASIHNGNLMLEYILFDHGKKYQRTASIDIKNFIPGKGEWVISDEIDALYAALDYNGIINK